MLSMEEREEIQERQDAELEYVNAAYSPTEAWISQASTTKKSKSSSSSEEEEEHSGQQDEGESLLLHRIHRRLDLPIFTTTVDGHCISLEFILTMPRRYPLCAEPHSRLQLEAKILGESNNHHRIRKLAFNSIPNLLQYCQNKQQENEDGGEEVLMVLTNAEEWVQYNWNDILRDDFQLLDTPEFKTERMRQDQQLEPCDFDEKTRRTVTIGRKILYSHHIIAKTKRKSMTSLSKRLGLTGYVKIGWPGIIILEGLEENCSMFVEELMTWRWQLLELRGEETETVVLNYDDCDGSVLDERRRFKKTNHQDRQKSQGLEELKEDQTSFLAQRCREADLENLFLSCLKIYKTEE